jgi:hypothetical protein
MNRSSTLMESCEREVWRANPMSGSDRHAKDRFDGIMDIRADLKSRPQTSQYPAQFSRRSPAGLHHAWLRESPRSTDGNGSTDPDLRRAGLAAPGWLW